MWGWGCFWRRLAHDWVGESALSVGRIHQLGAQTELNRKRKGQLLLLERTLPQNSTMSRLGLWNLCLQLQKFSGHQPGAESSIIHSPGAIQNECPLIKMGLAIPTQSFDSITTSLWIYHVAVPTIFILRPFGGAPPEEMSPCVTQPKPHSRVSIAPAVQLLRPF